MFTHDGPARPTGESDVPLLAEYLAWDLARARRSLSEIEASWRRARSTKPKFPPGLPLQLSAEFGQLEADVLLLAGTNDAERPGLALGVMRQFASLRADVASAEAMTEAAGAPAAADGELWESAAGALQRSGSLVLALLLHVVPVSGWSLENPGPGQEKARLLLELG
ncbi:MAG: hypothetical protein ACYCPF_02665 [Streptosporangiaceae bacterium]